MIVSTINWLKKHGWAFPDSSAARCHEDEVATIPFTVRVKSFIKKSIITYRIIDLCGDLFWKVVQLGNLYSLYGFNKTLMILFGFVEEDNRSKFRVQSVSLRKILEN